MCFKPKRNPKVDEQLKKQEAEAKAAKAKAQEELAAKKAEALEAAKQKSSQVTEGQEYRQSETGASTSALARRSRRKGTSGRRSLITGSTAQGYFSRFL